MSLSTAAVEPEPAEDDRVLLAIGAAGRTDDVARVLSEAGRLQAGAAGLGVGVRVQRHDLLSDVVLDEGQIAAGGGVIGIRQTADAEGAQEGLVIADDAAADEGQQLVGIGVARGRGQDGVGHRGAHRSDCPGNSALAAIPYVTRTERSIGPVPSRA